jgi:hypothetical protein
MLWKHYQLQFSHEIALDESFIPEDNFLCLLICSLILCAYWLPLILILELSAPCLCMQPLYTYWASVLLISCTVVAIFLWLEIGTVFHFRIVLWAPTINFCVFQLRVKNMMGICVMVWTFNGTCVLFIFRQDEVIKWWLCGGHCMSRIRHTRKRVC